MQKEEWKKGRLHGFEWALGRMGAHNNYVKKLLVISLEGGSWEIFNKFIVRNKMPYLKSLRHHSFWGPLETFLPTLVYPTWASFWTGENPEKHKIFGFKNLTSPGKITNISSKEIEKLSFLKKLSQNGVKLNIIFAPLTYPPYDVNGFMISEQHIMQNQENITYPPNFKKEIIEKFGEINFPKAKQYYPKEGLDNSQKIKLFIKNQKESVTNTCKLASFTFENKEWDLSIIHLFATDPVLHSLFGEITKPKGLKNLEINRQIDNFFTHLDLKIRSLVKDSCADSILIFSTNGFTKTKKIIHLANVFEELKLSQLLEKEKIVLEFKSIHIYNKLHNKDRIVKELVKKLESIKDPETNKKIIKKAWLSQEYYHTKPVGDWSTILLDFKEGYTSRGDYNSHELLSKVRFPKDYLIGTHTNESMWLFSNKHIKKSKEVNAKVTNLTKIILNCFEEFSC